MGKPNYEGVFSPSEIARILHVEIEIVKKWSFVFADYLSKEANPPKGIPRKFTTQDLRVFAYVMTEWEDDPDIACIEIGLNSNQHYEDVFDEVVKQALPIFMDTSVIEDGENIGMIFTPPSEFGDTYELARSYKLAGDTLVDTALKDDMQQELICPILHNYRHAIELFLKATKKNRKGGHDLIVLMLELKALMKTEFNTEPPDWFDNVIKVFNDFDDRAGTLFRYGSSKYYEVYINLYHLKAVLTWISDGFENIRVRRAEKLVSSN